MSYKSGWGSLTRNIDDCVIMGVVDFLAKRKNNDVNLHVLYMCILYVHVYTCICICFLYVQLCIHVHVPL